MNEPTNERIFTSLERKKKEGKLTLQVESNSDTEGARAHPVGIKLELLLATFSRRLRLHLLCFHLIICYRYLSNQTNQSTEYSSNTEKKFTHHLIT